MSNCVVNITYMYRGRKERKEKGRKEGFRKCENIQSFV
jgi:hypothetical protein